MTHADVIDCLSANKRINFLAVMPEEAYKGSKITIQDAEDFLEDTCQDPVDCFKCSGSIYCHHMADYWEDKAYNLAEAEATGN